MMGARRWIESWPVYRQVAERDWLGLGAAVKSERSERLAPRVRDADSVVKSVCPYCAVGCAQNVYVKDSRGGSGGTDPPRKKVIQIEGDPDSPVSRGRLCPKGSASLQLTTGGSRQYQVRYRRPFGTDWEDLDLDTAMDMIADRVLARASARLAVGGGRGPDPADAGVREPGRRDAGQRGKLPDQEAVHGAGRDPDREPGPDLTLLHRPRSGDQLRPRRGHQLPP